MSESKSPKSSKGDIGVAAGMLVIFLVLMGFGFMIGYRCREAENYLIEDSRTVQQCEVQGRSQNCQRYSAWHLGENQCSCMSQGRRIQWELDRQQP
jgi:hypothetical protein